MDVTIEKNKSVKKTKTVKKSKPVLEKPYGLIDAIRSKGKTSLIKHFNGEKITATQAIHSKCCECNGYWADGVSDCKMPSCPLYDWQLYRKAK